MTIVEQAAARGVPVPVGATAGELRAAGWDVPANVNDGATLDTMVPGEPVNVMLVNGRPSPPRPTGYVWRGWRPRPAGSLS